MTELFLAYAQKDGDATAFVAEGLRKAGYAIATGYTSDGQPKPAEEAALEVKRSAAVVPLLTGASDESADLRRQLRAGLLYEKPLVAARLDEAAQTGVYGGDRALIVGTTYEDEPEALTQVLERAIDLYENAAASGGNEVGFKDDASSASYLAGAAASSDPREVSHLVAALRAKGVEPRVVSKGAAEAREPAPCDSLGLPKSAEAMLAHWRLISKDGATRDFKRFADDYSDDPYFVALADEAKQKLRRKGMMRGVNIAADSVFGMIVAGALAYGAYGVFCDAGQCGIGSANAAAIAVPQGATVDAQQFMRARQVAENAMNAARQMRAQLNQAEQQAQRMAVALRDAERRAQTAEARLAEAETALRRARADGGAGGDRPQPAPPPRQAVAQTGSGASDAMRAQLAQAQRESEAARRELAQARGELSQSRNELNRARGEARALNDRVAQLSAALSDREERIVALQAAVRSGGGSTAAAAAAPPPQAAATRTLNRTPPPPRGTTSLAGAEALLVYYRDQLQQASQNGRRRPALDADDLQALQACILRHTGALARVDGVWGLETTSALFTLDAEEASWIIDCVQNR